MSQHTVITDGYGTFGSASFVITDGYSISAEVATPFPLCITIGKQTEYGITTDMQTEYGITTDMQTEYGITISHGGCS
jgi:hypothetical protein